MRSSLAVRFNCLDTLYGKANNLYLKANKDPFLILIGGCSRSGKSSLSSELAAKFVVNGVNVQIITLDSWVIPVNDRPIKSLVIDRYDMDAARQAVCFLLQNGVVEIPVYDPVLRGSSCNLKSQIRLAKKTVLIIEGVLALCDEGLTNKSNLKIFVDVNDSLRIKRLIRFYRDVKKLRRDLYKNIILEREVEEVVFVKKSAIVADFLFKK